MEQNAYKNELNQVVYTEAGRAALTEALLEARPAPRRRSWTRKGFAALLAAVLLVGSVGAAAGPVWNHFFGALDEDQQAVIETLSQDLPAAESNGTTMTPLAAFGDQDFYYLMLEIRAPEGTVLPDYSEDEGFYQLFGDTVEEDVTLTDSSGLDLLCTLDYEWLNENLHIPGLWVQSPDKIYTPVLSGSWDFNIGTHSGGIQSLTPNISGVTIEHEDCGTMTMEYLRLSPLGMRIRHSWSELKEGIYPGASLSVVMEDGSEVALVNTVGSSGENWNEEYGPFETPIDLSKAVAVRWGDAEIPVR